MTLDELVKERAREVLDVIERTEEQVRAKEGEKTAAEARAAQMHERATGQRPIVEERERTVREIQARVRDIERQMAELGARLKDRRKEMEDAATLASDSRHKVAEFQKDERRESERVSDLDRAIVAMRTELATLNKRLDESRLAALAAYNEAVWKQMVSVATSIESKKAAFNARAALNQARQRMPNVRSLVEAREEWLRILKSVVPPLVKETATVALQKVEADIEHMFPLALSADAMGQAEDALLLYYDRAGETGTIDVFVPIPRQIWDGIASGRKTEAETLAMELVWALAAGFPKSESAAVFSERAGLRLLRLAVGEDTLTNKEIPLSLPPAATIAFYFSSLPGELREALHHADSNS